MTKLTVSSDDKIHKISVEFCCQRRYAIATGFSLEVIHLGTINRKFKGVKMTDIKKTDAGVYAILHPIYPPDTNPLPLGSAVTWEVETPNVIDIIVAEDTLSAEVHPVEVGTTRVHQFADADPSENVVTIENWWEVTVSLAEGLASGFSVEVVPIPAP